MSLDGYIARLDGTIDWLTSIPDPDPSNYGYDEFISKIDAIVMGRNTFDFVKNMSPWFYSVPVYVLTTSLNQSDIKLKNVFTINLKPPDIVKELNSKGFTNLYIDGGKSIQSFLSYDLIDEMTITKIPVLIGSGIPLFGNLAQDMHFVHIQTVTYSNGLVKSIYKINHVTAHTRQ